MARPPRYTIDEVCAALTETRGMVSPAARKLGCSYQTILNYRARYPRVEQAITEQRERFVDNTELRLIEAVEKKGDLRAIMYVLSRLGKDRGYVERIEKDLTSGGEPLIRRYIGIDLDAI